MKTCLLFLSAFQLFALSAFSQPLPLAKALKDTVGLNPTIVFVREDGTIFAQLASQIILSQGQTYIFVMVDDSALVALRKVTDEAIVKYRQQTGTDKFNSDLVTPEIKTSIEEMRRELQRKKK